MDNREKINRWVFRIPVEDIKENDSNVSKDDPCFCCGKSLKNQKTKYYIHLIDYGSELVSSAEDFGDEDFGFYRIGSTCRHKLPNNFTFKEV